MMRKEMLWVLSCVLLLNVQLYATARYQCLAGAYTGLADTPDAMFYNPAGLGHVNTATLNYSPYYLVYLSYPVSVYGTLGVGWEWLNDSNAHEVTLCYAKNFGRLGVGIAPSATIGGSTSLYSQLDAGLTCDLSDIFFGKERKLDDLVTVGLSIQDMFYANEPTVFRLRLGIRLFNERLNLASDISYPLSSSQQTDTPSISWYEGIELKPWRTVAVRAGVNNESFSVGAGLNTGYLFQGFEAELDYAFSKGWGEEIFPSKHVLTLSFDFPRLNGIWCKAEPEVLTTTEYVDISVFGVDRFPDIQRWSFEIINPNGRVIYRQTREVTDKYRDALPSEFKFDSSRMLLKNGKYSYRITATDRFGDQIEFEGFSFKVYR